MVGMKEVAERAGVSVSTVSYAISGRRPISGDTKHRVLQAARELGYFHGSSAVTPRGERTRFLAVSDPIHAATNDGRYADFFLQVAKRARSYDYDIVLLTESASDERVAKVVDAGMVDGVLLLDVRVDDERVRRAATSPVPYVAIGVPRDTSHLVCVDFDFERACHDAIDRLAALGHSHCVFFGSNPAEYRRRSNFTMRILGSLQHYAKRNGMTLKGYSLEGTDFTTVCKLVDQAFVDQPNATAILTQSDSMFLGGLVSRLLHLGKRIPEDVSVLSIGTVGDASGTIVPLDELPMDPECTCGRAVDLMQRILSGEDVPVGTVEKLEIPYVDRGSVGPATKF
ncbi:LacI family DNA-binding transcriptional regulator [Bifidobacterium tissieri]|uniref:LacI family DNA-binding transcriptional regulator n=1 Tax=Bifidobacterium tissieri TaxID=1630162 RepID=UPI001238DC76|nr:LacI family DNA-binding transcriptional regulator [Bifidobacterium tissieri]KAA8830164.1 LacI family transcriptional regulator [Bifidobacterium tissieri]